MSPHKYETIIYSEKEASGSPTTRVVFSVMNSKLQMAHMHIVRMVLCCFISFISDPNTASTLYHLLASYLKPYVENLEGRVHFVRYHRLEKCKTIGCVRSLASHLCHTHTQNVACSILMRDTMHKPNC